jgi:hypothetical protein
VPQFNYNDSVNFLSKLTPRRLWNGAKVYFSYKLSRFTGKPIVWGIPISISFEPTTSCNLRCPECPSGLRAFTRPTGMLQPSFFNETIDSVYKDLIYLIFYFQGEPFLNPSFLDMVAYASKKGIYTATSTNAHYLTEENAKILGWLPQSVLKDDYPFNQLSIWANPMIEDAVAALEDLYQASPYRPSIKAIEAGQAFSVQNLANKYEPILRSYLR